MIMLSCVYITVLNTACFEYLFCAPNPLPWEHRHSYVSRKGFKQISLPNLNSAILKMHISFCHEPLKKSFLLNCIQMSNQKQPACIPTDENTRILSDIYCYFDRANNICQLEKHFKWSNVIYKQSVVTSKQSHRKWNI